LSPRVRLSPPPARQVGPAAVDVASSTPRLPAPRRHAPLAGAPVLKPCSEIESQLDIME